MNGNVKYIRDSHKRSYTCISNQILRDKRLSESAKGILCQILSYPDDWYLYKSGIEKETTDRRCAIETGLSELERFGYLKITKSPDHFLFYTVIEKPSITETEDIKIVQQSITPAVENQHSDLPSDSDFQHTLCKYPTPETVEFHQLLNPKINTDIPTTTDVAVSFKPLKEK
ncbi:MAG: helix-turn-helix domain-containing protein, partial [Treponema sp.]